MTDRYDVLGIGNAIMDIIAPVSDNDLKQMVVTKGAMTLIDEARALDLHGQLKGAGGDLREIAGGSAANTLVGIAMMGVASGYIGKVADDAVGTRFVSGMQDVGVDFKTPPLKDGEATARCLIAVTPDGERSMSTFLGASVYFSKSDVARDMIESAKILYLEGYLFDRDEAKAAFVAAAEIAKAAGRDVALTLSDSFCVDRHRESFKRLVDNHVDIVFANEAELLSLYQVNDFEEALSLLVKQAKVACVTRSEKGSVIIENGMVHNIDAEPVDNIVDTTGAGDQYAAGVLAGRAMGLSWPDAGVLGSRCAAEVISHYGARPEVKITL